MTNNSKICSFCSREIPLTAKKCPYCLEWLVPPDNSFCGIGFRNPIVMTITAITIIFLLLLIINTHRATVFTYYFALIVIGCGLYLYMLPSIIALSRKHPQFVPILFTNIFFAETGIGWILTMIWATSHRPGRYTPW